MGGQVNGSDLRQPRDPRVCRLGGQKADRNGTRLELAVESARLGAAIKGSAKPLYVSSILTRTSNLLPSLPMQNRVLYTGERCSRAE